MPTLDDIYCKFGEAAEAASIIETDLGTMALFFGVVEGGLISETLEVDSKGAREVLHKVNRQTLGQLLKSVKGSAPPLEQLDDLLNKALAERNRLFHSFYRQHNMRKFSVKGRLMMMEDLESIHEVLLDAMKAISLLMGTDLDALVAQVKEARGDAPPDDDGEYQHLPI